MRSNRTLRPILQNNENVIHPNNVKNLDGMNSHKASSSSHPTVHKPSHNNKTPKSNSTKKRRALGDISNRTTSSGGGGGGKAILLQKNGNTVSKKGLGGNVSTKKSIARKSKLSSSQTSRKSVSFALFEDKGTTEIKRPPVKTHRASSELKIHLDSKPKQSLDNHDDVEDIEVLAGRSYIEEQEYFDNEPIRSLGVDDSIIFPVMEEHFRKKRKEKEKQMIKTHDEQLRIADAKLEETIRQIGINDAVEQMSPCSILEADCMEDVINFDDEDGSDDFFSKIISEIDDSMSDLAV